MLFHLWYSLYIDGQIIILPVLSRIFIEFQNACLFWVNYFQTTFQARQSQLKSKMMHLERQVSGLQEEGVAMLKARMKEVWSYWYMYH